MRPQPRRHAAHRRGRGGHRPEVRTLHHYDEIGLLAPSGRSEAGYRLCADDGVRRLYRIVAFRRLGFALGEIGALLDGEGADPRAVVRTQLFAWMGEAMAARSG